MVLEVLNLSIIRHLGFDQIHRDSKNIILIGARLFLWHLADISELFI